MWCVTLKGWIGQLKDKLMPLHFIPEHSMMFFNRMEHCIFSCTLYVNAFCKFGNPVQLGALGYYDLRDRETREAQGKLAAAHGVALAPEKPQLSI
jgi:hypothetical protein